MKRMLIYAVLVLMAGSCQKVETTEGPSDPWNGYDNYYKSGEVTHTLWAGKNIDVGTVTYGIDSEANFYVRYDCSSLGWLISETHMFAGDKVDMPVNNPGNPRVGRFPYSACHSPYVSTYTYTVPLSSLPPAEVPGFVVAAHCVVHGPSGSQETAWAEGDCVFGDKGWGWYDVYYFNQLENQADILYGIQYKVDTMQVYMINVEDFRTDLVFSEFVGSAPASYDAAAYDETSGMFFFANYSSGELWINPMLDDGASFCAGTLFGTPAGASCYAGAYYYVNAEDNGIYMVEFDASWNMQSITAVSFIPLNIGVNDIAMSPDGSVMYILGDQSDGAGSELIAWNVALDEYYIMAIDMDAGGQIAFGSDGTLYAVVPVDEGYGSMIYLVDTNAALFTPVSDAVLEVDDPFTDLSHGRIM